MVGVQQFRGRDVVEAMLDNACRRALPKTLRGNSGADVMSKSLDQ